MTRTRMLVAGLTVALVASLVAVVLLWRDRDADAARAQELVTASLAAEQAARDAVELMTTYDHRTVEEDFAAVHAAGTERFRESFAAATEPLIGYIRRVRASAEGSVVDSAATAADARHVKVLLFVDQRIRSEGTEDHRVDQPRVTMQMVRRDGEWLVDEVEVVNLLEGARR